MTRLAARTHRIAPRMRSRAHQRGGGGPSAPVGRVSVRHAVSGRRPRAEPGSGPQDRRRARRPAVGVDGADPLGGARPPRRGRDQPAAGRAGGPGHAEARRQRRRRGRRHRGDARRHRAAQRRHRRRHVRHLLLGQGPQALRAERGRLVAAVVDARVLPRTRGSTRCPTTASTASPCPGGRRLGQLLKRFGTMSLAQALQPSIKTAKPGLRPDRADPRRLEQLRPVLRRHAARRTRSRARCSCATGTSPRCTASSATPGLAKRLRADRQGRARGVLRRPDRPGHRQPHERRRRGLEDVRPAARSSPSGSTRSRQLQGLRRLPDAAADAGLRDARDAEHPRAVRAEARATT